MLETILLAFLYAKIKKYKIKPLFKTWAIYPIVIFEIITTIGVFCAWFGEYKILNVFGSATTVYLLFYIGLIFKYKLYVQAIIGSSFMVFGGMLNDIAIKANNGFMPVFQSLSYHIRRVTLENYHRVNDIHILGDKNSNVKILTDYIDLGYTILSVGDIFIRVFVFLIIYYSIKKINLQGEVKNC